jgi:sensor histidine kinase YesM
MNAWRAWLAQTFSGLTWQSFGRFCLVIVALSLSEPASMVSVTAGGGFVPITLGLLKPFAFTFLLYFPVLLAVVAVENRGPQQGRARIAALISAVVISQSVGATLWAAVIPWLYPDGYLTRWLGPLDTRIALLRYFGGHAVMALVVSLIATTLYLYLKRNAKLAATLHEESVQREDVERNSAEARLKVMQAQIEPHFLFNTLASVRHLYQTDRGSGRAMLQHLSRYLTASLPAMRESTSTLGREIALTTAYLNVQQIRMGPRLRFDCDVPEPLRALIIPPMMLATLAENAVIHGLGSLPQGGSIRISARISGNRLVVAVADNGRGLQETWGGGVGLANIRARLLSTYGDQAKLVLGAGPEGGVSAVIELPLPPLAELKAA